MRIHTLCTFFLLILCSACSQMHSSLSAPSNEMGFQRLQTAQKNLEPGTVIAFEESGEGMTAVVPVCWKHQAFPRLLSPQSAPEVAVDLKREVDGWVDLEPEYLDVLQTKYPEIQDIQLLPRHASVSQYSNKALSEAVETRSQPCREAVAAREANGETVYTVVKVLTADMTYKVIGVERDRMTGKLPHVLLERLKTDLGGSSVSTFNQTIKGSRLPIAFQADVVGPKGVPSFITKDERQSMMQKVAILADNASDADRLQKK